MVQEDNQEDDQEQTDNALVYSYQFLPETSFEFITDVDDDERLLTGEEDAEDAETDIPNPGEYDAWAIRYTFSDVPYHAFLFVPDDSDIDPDQDSEWQLNRDASFLGSERNVLETQVSSGGEEGGDEGEEETPEEEGAETETPTETGG